MVVGILRHQPFTAFALGHLHQSLGRKQRHTYQRYRTNTALVLSIGECIFANPNVRNWVIKKTILNTGVHRFRQSQASIQLDQSNELVGLEPCHQLLFDCQQQVMGNHRHWPALIFAGNFQSTEWA